MGIRNVFTGLIAAALLLSFAVAAPAVGLHAQSRNRHEFSVAEGPLAVSGAVEVSRGRGGPQDVQVGHELDIQGLPQAPAGPGPGSLGPLGIDGGLTLPNLAPLPPYDVFVGPAEQPQGPVWSNLETLGAGEPPTPLALRFTTTILSRGKYSFELIGTPWTPDPNQEDLMTTQAYQCVRFDGPHFMGTQRNCVRYNPVGTLTWHAQHRHFHINGFGRYELRREVNGKADMSKAGLVGRSQKVGWCVSDMWNWREDESPGPVGEVGDAALDPYERNWYSECTNPVLYTGASWRQGISPGWADTYPARYTGQEIPLKGVKDGIYWLVTTINPKDNEFGLRVQETTWADNSSYSRVQLYDNGKKARLLGPMPKEPYSEWYSNPEDQPGN